MSNKQKIAFACHPYHRGGVTRWMADAAITLSRLGHEIYFITLDPAKDFFSAGGRETVLQLLEKEANSIHILKAQVGYEFEFGTHEYRAYIYKKLIVQLPSGTPVILSDAVALWEAATSLHESYPVIGVLHADEHHYYHLAEKHFLRTDILVSVSSRINANVRKRVPDFDSSRLFTIPCGINLPAIDLHLHSGNVLQLVYVGRISDFQKRTGDLVKIAATLKTQNVPFQLGIIGDGDARAILEHKFIESGLQEYVTFTGWLSQQNVAKYLSESDILILTSDFEGTPIAMMEALAAGCGVVGTRVSGIEDYESHPLAADCLSVFSVGDTADAVAKINKLSAIPVNMRKIAARKLAEREFSMKVCLDKYLKAIGTIKPRSAAPPPVKISSADLLYSNALAYARKLKVRFMPNK